MTRSKESFSGQWDVWAMAEPCWDHLTETRALAAGLWFPGCPQSPLQNSQQGDPHCPSGKLKKQKHLACIANSNFYIQGLLNLTSAHECERVAGVKEVTWQGRQTSLEQGGQTYGGLLGAKTLWEGDEDDTVSGKNHSGHRLRCSPELRTSFQQTV